MKCIFSMQINIEVQLDLNPQPLRSWTNTQPFSQTDLSYLTRICDNNIQSNIESFYMLTLSFCLCVTRHAQNMQNEKLAYLSNIYRKAWGDEVDFLLITWKLYKHESFLQYDSIILGVCCQSCSNCPKQQVFNIFAISHRKLEGWSWFLACR